MNSHLARPVDSQSQSAMLQARDWLAQFPHYATSVAIKLNALYANQHEFIHAILLELTRPSTTHSSNRRDLYREVVQLSLNNNKLTHLHIAVCDLVNLQCLELAGNKIQQLPANIGQLRRLRRLDLQHNALTRLPTSLSQCEQLQRLDLSYNRLLSFPAWICNFDRLKDLFINHNMITLLPNNLNHLRSLERLNLACNYICEIPANISSLRRLNTLIISHNRLRRLPRTLVRCHKIKRLYVDHNQLRALPDNIGDMTALSRLFVHRNHIRTLPSSFDKLSNLRRLRLGCNPLTRLPANINRLSFLGLDGCLLLMLFLHHNIHGTCTVVLPRVGLLRTASDQLSFALLLNIGAQHVHPFNGVLQRLARHSCLANELAVPVLNYGTISMGIQAFPIIALNNGRIRIMQRLLAMPTPVITMINHYLLNTQAVVPLLSALKSYLKVFGPKAIEQCLRNTRPGAREQLFQDLHSVQMLFSNYPIKRPRPPTLPLGCHPMDIKRKTRLRV